MYYLHRASDKPSLESFKSIVPFRIFIAGHCSIPFPALDADKVPVWHLNYI